MDSKQINQKSPMSDREITPRRLPGGILRQSPSSSVAALYESSRGKLSALKEEIREFMRRVGEKSSVTFVKERLLEDYTLTELYEMYDKSWQSKNAAFDDLLNMDVGGNDLVNVPIKRKIDLVIPESSDESSPKVKKVLKVEEVFEDEASSKPNHDWPELLLRK